MVCNVLFEGRRGVIFAALSLNGDDFSTVLQHKVNLAVLIREIARLNFKLTAKLLQNIVFSQRSLERIIALQKDSSVVYASHVLEQSGVEYKELELTELVKCRKRMLHLGNIVNTVEQPG